MAVGSNGGTSNRLDLIQWPNPIPDLVGSTLLLRTFFLPCDPLHCVTLSPQPPLPPSLVPSDGSSCWFLSGRNPVAHASRLAKQALLTKCVPFNYLNTTHVVTPSPLSPLTPN